jgi:hypothetical protein
MKIILSILLGIYSIAMGAYALSEIYEADGCSAGCYGGETAFAGGAGSTPGGTRAVNVKPRAAGPNGFQGANATKLNDALATAMNKWNTATDGTSTTPYNFRQAGTNAADIEIVFVETLPKGNSSKEPCMRLMTTKNAQGGIEKGTLYIPRKVLEKSSLDDLSELIQHELGHFIGLADFYGNADQCETVMAQADGCTGGLKGSEKIASKDVANVKKYVNGSPDCKADRKPASHVVDGGGYVDPNPSPYYYPRTCYYFYDAIDVYVFCDCVESGSPRGYRYVGTVYYLTDVFCTY